MKRFLDAKENRSKIGRTRIIALQTKDEIDFNKYLNDIGMDKLEKDQLRALKTFILTEPENFRYTPVFKY